MFPTCLIDIYNLCLVGFFFGSCVEWPLTPWGWKWLRSMASLWSGPADTECFQLPCWPQGPGLNTMPHLHPHILVSVLPLPQTGLVILVILCACHPGRRKGQALSLTQALSSLHHCRPVFLYFLRTHLKKNIFMAMEMMAKCCALLVIP